MKKILLAVLLLLPLLAQAEVNFKVDTPAISAIRQSLRSRHEELERWLDTGAVGLTNDGMLSVRDPALIPLPERQKVNSLVTDENRDWSALYLEIARANGHPEWETEVRSTFVERRVAHAHAGWWYQDPRGNWLKK